MLLVRSQIQQLPRKRSLLGAGASWRGRGAEKEHLALHAMPPAAGVGDHFVALQCMAKQGLMERYGAKTEMVADILDEVANKQEEEKMIRRTAQLRLLLKPDADEARTGYISTG